MPQGCPLSKNHPVSAQHVTTYARKRHMGAEATLSAAQPTKVRKLLQDKFGSHLISKDLINIKQTLTGKSANEWRDTVDYLMDLQKEENNVIMVLHDADGEVAAIYVQLEKQRQMYRTYADDKGDGQPVAMFFMKEETVDSISTCLQLFSETNDVSVTTVTITDKDCVEIAALAKYFTSATHILCHFHVLKAVDAKLLKLKNLGKEKKHAIQQHFRSALFATTHDEFDSSRERLLSIDGSVTAHFRNNWFNSTDKWSSLGRR
ncbi:hypothetical protein OUZ56_029559 [Daphnia magna]|uniref:ZSWIM1/3 RNaseH-like domain-containing protein n=1 Tax=Daphnia magna TaxID=35525 RepID=A0ABR0B763_9CRUS|nr:hypothetical protein OUZ56_029559 [Daphnia magna]